MGLRSICRQLLNVDAVRTQVAQFRWLYYVRIRKQLRSVEATDASQAAVAHNLKGTSDLSVRRSLVLIRPLVTALIAGRPGCPVEQTSLNELKVLSIGPRTEGELLNLIAHGFMPENVRGLDLISYSPWIDLGDMHAMPYADSSWDAIVFGWTLAYSNNKKKAAAEIIRVAKNGAVIAVGVEYCCLSNEQIIAQQGYLPGSAERIWSVADIMQHFAGHVGVMYFQNDVTDERRKEMAVPLIAVFSIQK